MKCCIPSAGLDICILDAGEITTVRKCDLLLVRLSVFSRFMSTPNIWNDVVSTMPHTIRYIKYWYSFVFIYICTMIAQVKLFFFRFCSLFFFVKKKFMVCLASFGNFEDLGWCYWNSFTVYFESIIKMYDSKRVHVIFSWTNVISLLLFSEICKETTFQWYLKRIFSICRSYGYCKYISFPNLAT